jgi:hypothetical protein
MCLLFFYAGIQIHVFESHKGVDAGLRLFVLCFVEALLQTDPLFKEIYQISVNTQQTWESVVSSFSCSVCVTFFPCAAAPSGPGSPRYRGFTVTHWHTTLGRTPLNEWSARRRDLYLTTHPTLNNRQTFMSLPGFELAFPARERPQTHALDRAATGVDIVTTYRQKK